MIILIYCQQIKNCGSQDEFILCIKTWLNVDDTLNKVLELSGFTNAEKLLDGGNQAESAIFLVSR